VLKDWEPPETIARPRVRPWVGRTLPVERGIQSIWFLKTAVCGMSSVYRKKGKRWRKRRGVWSTYQVSMLFR
jgi:hypothetical protein